MTNSGKLFSYELTEWFIEAGFILSQCHMSIYYNYALDRSKIVVLCYVDDCVYWYTYEALGKGFVGTLGKILHVKFLGYAHWFMSIRIYQMNYHSISVDQDIYATSIVGKTMILSQLRQVQSFIRPYCHLILYSQNMIHLPVMKHLRS